MPPRVKRGVAPSVRSPSGILTNAATTGGPPGTQQGPPSTGQSRAINRPNTIFAAGGAGGGSGAGATPAVIAAQQRPRRGGENTIFAAGGAGGGSGAGSTPAVIAAQKPPGLALPGRAAQQAHFAPQVGAGVGLPGTAGHPSNFVSATPEQQAGLSQLGPGFPAGYTGENFERPIRDATTDTQLIDSTPQVTYVPAPGAASTLPPDNEFFRMLAGLESDEARAQKGFDMGLIDQPALDALLAQETMNINAPEFQWNKGVGVAGNQIGLAPTGIPPGAPMSDAPAGGAGLTVDGMGGGVATTLTPIETQYVDMYGDLRDDAQTAYDTSDDYYTTGGDLGREYWEGVGGRSDAYYDERGLAAEGYYGGMRDDALDYLTAQQEREEGQILAMADMRRGNIGDQYQWMLDALDAEELRRSGVYNDLETMRGSRLDANEAALLGQMGTLEGERLAQEQAMREAMSGRYAGAQAGLDTRQAQAAAALQAQGVGPEAYTAGVGAETAALLGSQGLSSQNLQDRLASITASEATDRALGVTGLYQDARSALADQLFGGRADLAEDIAGRSTSMGLQNMQALGDIGVGELGAQQGLSNLIAQGQFGVGQDYSTGMYDTGENIAAGRFDATDAALAGAYGVGQTERAGIYGAQQTYNAEMSRINEAEASGQISRAEAAVAKTNAEAKAETERQREVAQFAQIDTQMGLTPGTAQAMSMGGLLGDLYGDLMGTTESNEYENMMPWTSASGEQYFVDPAIAWKEEIRQGQGVTTVPQATYPVSIPGPDGQMVTVQMPINNWSDIGAMQEYEALR